MTIDIATTATLLASSRRRRVRAAGVAIATVLAAGGVGACGGTSPVSGTGASSKPTAGPITSGNPGSTATASTSTTAGLGEATKSVAQIVKDARLATSGVSSVEVKGALIQGGNRVALDVAAGQDTGAGSLTYKGATFHAVLRPPKLYIEASAASWKKAGSVRASKLLAGKWLEMASTTDTGFGSFSDLLRIRKLLSNLSSPKSLTKGTVTTFDGTRAVSINDIKKGTMLYVADIGKPYILAIVGHGSSSGNITFTHYNSTTIAGPPAHSFSLQQLENQG